MVARPAESAKAERRGAFLSAFIAAYVRPPAARCRHASLHLTPAGAVAVCRRPMHTRHIKRRR